MTQVLAAHDGPRARWGTLALTTMAPRDFPVSIPHGDPRSDLRSYSTIGELLGDAAGHARNRLLHACEAIAWVGGLALRAKPGARTPAMTIVGARVQDATARGGEQAAHVLPGQLLLDGREPWTLVQGEQARLAWLTRFMVTSPVPAPFNRADSAAEAAGLKEAFRHACEQAWSRVARGERDLLATHAAFLAAADRAFLEAEQGKGARATSGATQAVRNERLVESVLLRAYRAHGVTAEEANRRFPLRA